MRGTVAKKLRRAAEREMAGNPYRFLKTKKTRQVVHSVTSVRSYYQRLKKLYKAI